MKTKLISLVLTVAVILSCFATLIAAEGAGTPGFKVVGDPLGLTYATFGEAIDAANALAGTDVTIQMTGNTTSSARVLKTTTKNITVDGQGYTFTNSASSSFAKLGGPGSFSFTNITFDTTSGQHYFETDTSVVTLKFLEGAVFQNTGATPTAMPAMILPNNAHVIIDGAEFKLNYVGIAAWNSNAVPGATIEILSGTVSYGTHSSRSGIVTNGYGDSVYNYVYVDLDNVNVYVDSTTTRPVQASDLSHVGFTGYGGVAITGDAAKVAAFDYIFTTPNGVAYSNLAVAGVFAPNNSVITVEKSATLDGYMDRFHAAKTVTIQGKTGSEVLTLPAATAFAKFADGADVTIKNLTIQNKQDVATTAAYLLEVANAKLTLGEGVLLQHAISATGPKNSNGTASMVRFTAESTGSQLVIDGATINSAGTVINSDKASSTAEVKSGVINASARFYVANNGTTNVTATANLTISGGTINHLPESGYFFLNLYQTATKNIAITGGTINLAGSDTATLFQNKGTPELVGGKISIGGTVVYDAPAVTSVGSALYTNSKYPTDTTKGGIRFTSNLDLNSLDASLIESKVTFGTVIALKADYDALVDKTDLLTDLAKKINAVNTAGTLGNGNYSATLIQLSGNALSEELVGVPYVTIVVDGLGTYTYYGEAIVDAAANYDFFGLGA